nr:dna-3-methyladenine glycosylase [Quercus suber]
MSLRRSSRVSTKTNAEPLPNGRLAETASTSKKRARAGGKSSEAIAVDAIAQDGNSADAGLTMPPPPSTPVKRRKVAAKPPPMTPTPSAVGFMMQTTPKVNYSTGDIDDTISTPAPRPVRPQMSSASLVTPGGTQVQSIFSNFEEGISPSKSSVATALTNKTLLSEACAHFLKVDPKLKAVIDKHYCKVFSPEGLAETVNPFRSLTSGIMAQQVSGAAASSIKNKFVGLFPEEECPSGYPTPAAVAATSLPRLREAGLSQRKAEYIQGLAQKFVDGDLTVGMLMNGSDEEVMEKLVAVRGLGAWSVEMFMCFGLKRMDIFSTGDLGVQRGMAAYKGKDVAKLRAKGGGKWKYMGEQEMIDTAEVFRPYR